jgi:hypothetical protein
MEHPLSVNSSDSQIDDNINININNSTSSSTTTTTEASSANVLPVRARATLSQIQRKSVHSEFSLISMDVRLILKPNRPGMFENERHMNKGHVSGVSLVEKMLGIINSLLKGKQKTYREFAVVPEFVCF